MMGPLTEIFVKGQRLSISNITLEVEVDYLLNGFSEKTTIFLVGIYFMNISRGL